MMLDDNPTREPTMHELTWTVGGTEPFSLASLRDAFVSILNKLSQNAATAIPLAAADQPIIRIGQQVMVIVQLSAAKLKSLCSLLLYSIDQRDWLTYGMVGRSLIEHAATLRYYLREKIVPLLPDMENPANISPALLEEIQLILFQLIRGGRFDWTHLLEQWLAGVSLPEGPKPEQPNQVNVLTCIQKWNREEPRIEQIYSMFCDLVHPNLGSSLLVIGITPEAITFGEKCEHSLGESIALSTGSSVLSVAHSYLQAIEKMRVTAAAIA